MIAQLLILNEPVLAFAAIFPSLALAVCAVSMKGRHQKNIVENRQKFIFVLLVLLLLVPFGFHQSNVQSSSSWKEVGILLSGPYTLFLVFLSAPILLGIIIASRMQEEDE
jgi:NADH:ubiquinone oxidoreductase subunit 6 (subunit J)